MPKGYFITGTDTDAGKTYSTVKLIAQAKKAGKRVMAMKPIASGFEVDSAGHRYNEDLRQLCAASGQADDDLLCQFRFLPPISPHLAAAEAGQEIRLQPIVAAYAALAAQADEIYVEGVGGWLAPLSTTLCVADLAQALSLPVILVVGMRLGCLNHALLSAAAIRASGLEFAGWVANQRDPAMLRYLENRQTLEQRLGAPLLLEIGYGG